ncbi:fasciclin-1 [Anopheles nili]|uniref:fasciclin-1 n=1 Tax=Anopheles nili TaxID=185578 RepID=UPI00237AD53E|nr:fasciclin-1 [Anopheles nili]
MASKANSRLFVVFCRSWLILLAVASTGSSEKTLESHVREDPDLSEFYSLMERDEETMMKLKLNQLTIFAPTNKAFQRYSNNVTYVEYHIAYQAYKTNNMPRKIRSVAYEAPPMYITRPGDWKKFGTGDMFINNAKIIRDRSDLTFRNEKGGMQILHIIDDVLQPVTTMKTRIPASTDAWGILDNSENFQIDSHRVRAFRKIVLEQDKDQSYKMPGNNTYFVPVEVGNKIQGHQPVNRIDFRMIDGHIIGGKVVCPRTVPNNFQLDTLAVTDDLRVTLRFYTHNTDRNPRVFVISHSVSGNSRYTGGSVIAEVVKPNIPLENGMMHLIHRPLVLVNMTVMELLMENSHALWSKFRDLIEDYVPDFQQTLRNTPLKTIFLPQDEAVLQMMQTNFMSNRKKLREILLMHVVPGVLSTEKIKQKNQNSIFQTVTLHKRQLIYFNAHDNLTSRVRNVTVEAGGVNASVILGDIGAIDGYIHIIDHMLGVSYTSVQDKLRIDQTMRIMNRMGMQNNFNDQLNKTTQRFTYFVPRDKAWMQWFAEHPTPDMEEFMRNNEVSRLVLARHLVIADRAFTMGELRNMSHDSLILPTDGADNLEVRIKEEDNRFFIQWKRTNKWISVFRANVECTNGLIHVIDAPFLDVHDVNASGASKGFQATHFYGTVMLLMAIVFSNIAPFEVI